MLHVPWQRRRSRCHDWRAWLEDLHHRERTETNREEPVGHHAVGTVRRGHLGVAHGRREARVALRGHRQHVHGAAGKDERRGDGIHPCDRTDRVGLTGDAEGRVCRRVQPAQRAELLGRPRARLRFRQLSDARTRRRPRPYCDRPEVRSRLGAGPGQARRGGLAVSCRRRQCPWRYGVWLDRRCRVRVFPSGGRQRPARGRTACRATRHRRTRLDGRSRCSEVWRAGPRLHAGHPCSHQLDARRGAGGCE